MISQISFNLSESVNALRASQQSLARHFRRDATRAASVADIRSHASSFDSTLNPVALLPVTMPPAPVESKTPQLGTELQNRDLRIMSVDMDTLSDISATTDDEDDPLVSCDGVRITYENFRLEEIEYLFNSCQVNTVCVLFVSSCY